MVENRNLGKDLNIDLLFCVMDETEGAVDRLDVSERAASSFSLAGALTNRPISELSCNLRSEWAALTPDKLESRSLALPSILRPVTDKKSKVYKSKNKIIKTTDIASKISVEKVEQEKSQA